tara:strand:+ start:346 stop:525 length:180 start_codon:yes stop_codon:yes gene_type:complete
MWVFQDRRVLQDLQEEQLDSLVLQEIKELQELDLLVTLDSRELLVQLEEELQVSLEIQV